MRLAIGSDHHGVELKSRLTRHLEAQGHEVVNAGTDTTEPVDYPDIAATVSDRVSSGMADRGILICGSGIGMAMAANKVPGVRAAACFDNTSAEVCRRHNDANVLCLSGDNVQLDANERIVDLWMITDFDGGRHSRRVEKISGLERRNCDSSSDV